MLSKFLLAALAVTQALALSPLNLPVLTEADYEANWVEWKAQQADAGRLTLSSTEDEQLRFLAFRTNVDRVRNHNAQADAGEFSFWLHLNHLADLSDAEYKGLLTSSSSASPSSASGASEARILTATNSTVPDAFDWRTTPNVVGAVKNQGGCGSCWAFSGVATMEGAWNHKHATSEDSMKSFSEQQLVDCVNDGKNTCSIGGEMYQGVEYVANLSANGKQGGIELESSYKYKGSSGGGCKYDASDAVGIFSGYRNVTSGSEDALKVAAFQQPIVSVGIDASSFWFQLYHSGVYDHSGCSSTELDHGVAVVGYGSAETGFFKKTKKDYWIVRNSWGSMWGEKGYIRMVRNKKNQCGVATQACFAEL